jgi:hypothetical protein
MAGCTGLSMIISRKSDLPSHISTLTALITLLNGLATSIVHHIKSASQGTDMHPSQPSFPDGLANPSSTLRRLDQLNMAGSQPATMGSLFWSENDISPLSTVATSFLDSYCTSFAFNLSYFPFTFTFYSIFPISVFLPCQLFSFTNSLNIFLPKITSADIHTTGWGGVFLVTALYFYGSILLQALKSKIIVMLACAQKRCCESNYYVKVV